MKVEADPWLTRIFGHDVFRLVPGAHGFDPGAIQHHFRAREGRDGFYYAKVPTSSVPAVQVLTGLGFHVVDVGITFERGPGGQAIDGPEVPVRDARPEDRERLLAVAGSCFVYSRFHLDPRVPNAVANAIKREWVANYLAGRRGERVLVADDGGPVGFLAVLAADIHGRPGRIIDLVGVTSTHQGRGVGLSLVREFVRTAPEGTLLRVGTQAANIPSMRLYERCGFRVAETAYVLHAHVKGGQVQR